MLGRFSPGKLLRKFPTQSQHHKQAESEQADGAAAIRDIVAWTVVEGSKSGGGRQRDQDEGEAGGAGGIHGVDGNVLD